jgi:hypothetical protein
MHFSKRIHGSSMRRENPMNPLVKFESTPTEADYGPSELDSTLHNGGTGSIVPPHDDLLHEGHPPNIPTLERPPGYLRLGVAMTFEDDKIVLRVADIDVVAEARVSQENFPAQKAFGRLVEEVSAYLEASGSAKSELLRYPPHTWFRFVSPEQTAYADKATLTDGFISALNELYEFKGELVDGFLRENPSLSSLLFGAYGTVRKYFGPDAQMALEIVADPEALGDQQLFVLIRTELPRKEARARLAKLDRDWWLRALPAAEGKMEIALD